MSNNLEVPARMVVGIVFAAASNILVVVIVIVCRGGYRKYEEGINIEI